MRQIWISKGMRGPAESYSDVILRTPAMAAGVTDRLWEVADMVTVLETWEVNVDS